MLTTFVFISIVTCSIVFSFALVSESDTYTPFVRCADDSSFSIGPISTGIIHMGGNDAATDAHAYHICVGSKVLFFECDPELVEKCAENTRSFGHRCVQACLSNRTGTTTFYVADNQGMSNSLLPPGEMFREISGHDLLSFREISLPTTRYDTWKEENAAQLPQFNTLVVDVQGMEYEVIEGMGSYLDHIAVINVEVRKFFFVLMIILQYCSV